MMEAPASVDLPDKEERVKADDQEEAFVAPRKLMIKKQDAEQFGATPGCAGCRAAREGRWQQHSSECRARLEGEIGKQARGAERLSTRRAIENEALAKAVERSDKRQKTMDAAQQEQVVASESGVASSSAAASATGVAVGGQGAEASRPLSRGEVRPLSRGEEPGDSSMGIPTATEGEMKEAGLTEEGSEEREAN